MSIADDLLRLIEKNKGVIPLRLLSIDPGDTTGWSLFVNGALDRCGQVPGKHQAIMELIEKVKPTFIVFEEYRIYRHKLAQHANSNVPTLQLVGQISMICDMKRIPYFLQSAMTGKAFCTDDRLKQWNMFFDGQKHANDAIRHACTFMLFAPPKVKKIVEAQNAKILEAQGAKLLTP